MSILKSLQDAYLDYKNNYLTIPKYAEHNGLTIKQTIDILTIGQELHETGGYLGDR